MANDLVSDWMTPDPLVVYRHTTVPEAYQLMDEYKIRRLPVMDADDLIGIVTLGDLRAAKASTASSLSTYELEYFLSQQMVEDSMTADPITVKADVEISNAAQLMLAHKIGGLPVMDAGRLVGIITESDIFRALIELCGEKRPMNMG
ncbi:MAG: CBS domain-containing protein [Anaerolineales bacterium]|nr:CBS domain-containing protein [Anaerolineales bacterium]